MGLLNTITFDGKALSDFGVFLGGDGAFNSPARIGEMVHIPGRNGSLWMDENCFENIEVKYPAFIGTPEETDFASRLMEVRSWLASREGYCRLEDTYHADEYRLAVFKAAVETDPVHYTRAGGFDITFDAKPQRYLKSGDKPVTFYDNGTITNPTLFESLPIIAVSGNGRVNVGGHLFTVSDTTETIYIDSELMEVFIPGHDPEELTEENSLVITDELALPIEVYGGNREAINMNSHVSFADYEFPRIGPGEQPVAFDSGIESVVIYPRWWRL